MNQRALEDLFADLEWDVATATHEHLVAGQPLLLGAGRTAVVTVRSGALAVPSGALRCTLDPAGAHGRPGDLVEPGGVLLAVGRRAVTVRARSDAEVRVTRLLPTPTSAPRLQVVPDVITVPDLGASEPGAAALAPYVGHVDPAPARCHEATRLCRLMATTLVLAVLRAWTRNGCAPEGWPARTADRHLARALDAIHEHPGRPWTVEDLAAVAAMSRSAFAERFRAETGTSPLGYVTEVRMARARSLLADGVRVSEVARRLGYASDEGFSRAFRRHHDGVLPSAWREGVGVVGAGVG